MKFSLALLAVSVASVSGQCIHLFNHHKKKDGKETKWVEGEVEKMGRMEEKNYLFISNGHP